MRHYSAVLMTIVVAASAMLAGAAGAVDGASPSTADAQTADVSFAAQTTGGSTVVVDEVTVPEGGFVTIHDGSLGDGETFGSVVGSSDYLESGTHENVVVRLEKPLVEDDTLFAMPHTDTDGDRIYSFVSSNGEADGPYTTDGDIVMKSADVTVSASVETSAQSTNGESVVVDRVELVEGGFVTVHDSTIADGAVFESIRGTSDYLEAGVHENVRIQLDDPLAEDDTVYPMAHRDTNGNEAYDFPATEGTEDGPYATGEGDPVMTPTAVTLTDRAMVSFDAQASGGSSVVVEEAYVPEGGFVTIHDGSLGDGAVFESIRGTSGYLEPGLHRDVVVHLDDPLTEDDAPFAMAHQDTNDNEAYEFPATEGEEDGPYTADGDIVMESADVTVSSSVTASTQVSDGHTVVIDRVDLSEGGFVTVHDASLFEGEVFDSVVGTSEYLEAGTHENVEVTLDEPLRTSQTIVPMAHLDTNGNEVYDFLATEGAEDGPYTAHGDAVVDTAKVVVPATVTASDQQSDGETVVVDSVTLHDGGFVTIHDSTIVDGAVFDSVRGTSEYLGPGTHENVEITLDDPLAEDDDVFAMAHLDTNDDEVYDFLESDGADDGPYVAEGAPIMSVATVTYDCTCEESDEPTDDDSDDGTADSDDGMADSDEGADDESNEESSDGTADDDRTEDDSDETPGFGVIVATIALLAAAMIARRPDN